MRCLTHTLCLLLLALSAAVAAPYEFSGSAGGSTYTGSGDLIKTASGLEVRRTTAQGDVSGQLTFQNGAWEGTLTSVPGVGGALVGAQPQQLQTRVVSAGGGFRLEWSDAQGNSGSETWRADLPAPQGLSTLASDVFSEVVAVADQGNIPAELIPSSGNRIATQPLVNGPAIFGAVEQLITDAEHEVMIQTYIWDTPSQAGDAILRGLKALEARRRSAQAQTPVRVFIVINKHWTIRKNTKKLDDWVTGTNLDPAYVELNTATFRQKWFGLVHTKAFLVDGARAVLTSANVQAKQDGPDGWYDLGYSIEGPVCASLRAEFAHHWRAATKRPLPAAPPPVPAAIQGGVPVAVLTKRVRTNPFMRRFAHPLREAYVSAFRGAQRQIRILSPLLNDKILRQELVAAAQRGVSVQVLLKKHPRNLRAWIPGAGGTNTRNVKRLRKALNGDAAALARLDLRWFSADGQSAIDGSGPGALHGKYCTVDGELAIVGSSNHDAQSMKWSRELNLLVADPATVQAWDAAAFEPKWALGVPIP